VSLISIFRLQISCFIKLIEYKDFIRIYSYQKLIDKFEFSFFGLFRLLGRPLLTTLIYVIFFKITLKLGVNKFDYFIYIYSGMLPWLFISNSLSQSINCLSKDKKLLKNSNFPRIISPITSSIIPLFELVIGIISIILIQMLQGKEFSINWLFMPLLILPLVLFSFGVGLIISFPCIKYKRVKHFFVFIIPIIFYSLPIVYSINSINEKYRFYIMLNPIANYIESFRGLILNEGFQPNAYYLGVICSILSLVSGIIIFNRNEGKIVDYI
jgi:ABC-type polysaccharide/polyol phosphate export permease